MKPLITVNSVIKEPIEAVHTLVAYYFSTTNNGLVTKKYSFTEDFADTISVKERVERSLNTMLGSYLDRVVTTVNIEPDSNNLPELTINLEILDNGIPIHLSGIPTLTNDKSKIISFLFNEGTI